MLCCNFCGKLFRGYEGKHIKELWDAFEAHWAAEHEPHFKPGEQWGRERCSWWSEQEREVV